MHQESHSTPSGINNQNRQGQDPNYPMVHPLTFKQNALIAHLANDPHWTVSDKEKRPVNARILLDSGQVYNARFDGESPMVTLNELDANPNLDAVNRAYRLRARENRVIAIDVEPEAPEAMKQQALDMPAHFTELSMNGGVHLIIHVPEDIINDENRYMFDDLSVFKEPVPKQAPGEKQRSAYFEVLFNDHFITFTKRMNTIKPCVDYNTDAHAKAQLVSFIDNIVRLDIERKKEREIAKKYRIGMVEDSIDDEKKAMIEEFINLAPFEKARDQAESKNIADFSGDASRYEISVANGLAYHTLKTLSFARDTISFQKMAAALKEQDIVYAIYLLSKDVIPYRDKHDEDREGLPWLMYTAKRAYEFMQAKNAEERKRKK